MGANSAVQAELVQLVRADTLKFSVANKFHS